MNTKMCAHSNKLRRAEEEAAIRQIHRAPKLEQEQALMEHLPQQGAAPAGSKEVCACPAFAGVGRQEAIVTLPGSRSCFPGARLNCLTAGNSPGPTLPMASTLGMSVLQAQSSPSSGRRSCLRPGILTLWIRSNLQMQLPRRGFSRKIGREL